MHEIQFIAFSLFGISGTSRVYVVNGDVCFSDGFVVVDVVDDVIDDILKMLIMLLLMML